MNKELPSSAKRVQSFLIENGFTCIVKELSEFARTAEEAAKAIGCDVGQIAKSLVFIDKETENPILLIVSGMHRMDTKKIENFTGLHLIKADGNFVKERTGFAIGGVAPIGHKEKIVTFLDLALKNYEWIWAAAGTPFAVFKLNINEIERMTEGKFIDLKVEGDKN